MDTGLDTCGDSPRIDLSEGGDQEKVMATPAITEKSPEIIGEPETIEAAATHECQLARDESQNAQEAISLHTEDTSSPNDPTDIISLVAPRVLDEYPPSNSDTLKDCSCNHGGHIQNEEPGSSEQEMSFRAAGTHYAGSQQQGGTQGFTYMGQGPPNFGSRFLWRYGSPCYSGNQHGGQFPNHVANQYGRVYANPMPNRYACGTILHRPIYEGPLSTEMPSTRRTYVPYVPVGTVLLPEINPHYMPFIEMGVSTAPAREKGSVVSLCKSYGFISLNNGSSLLFFHFSQYLGEINMLHIGDLVEFSRTQDHLSGRTLAINMYKLRSDNAISEERFIGYVETAPSAGYPVPTPGRISCISRGQTFNFAYYKSSVENFSNIRVGDRVNFRAAANRIGHLCAYFIRLMTPGLVIFSQPIFNGH